MDVGPLVIPHAQAAKLIQPRKRPLDHPLLHALKYARNPKHLRVLCVLSGGGLFRSASYPCGLKYSTIPAPTAVIRKPRYNIGLTAAFGGWM